MHVTPLDSVPLCSGPVPARFNIGSRTQEEESAQPQCSPVCLRVGCLHPCGTSRRVVCLQGRVVTPLQAGSPLVGLAEICDLLPVARPHGAWVGPCISGPQEWSPPGPCPRPPRAGSVPGNGVCHQGCLLEVAGSCSPQKAQGFTAVGTAVRTKESPTNQEHLLSPPLFPRCPSPHRGQVRLCEASSRPPSFVPGGVKAPLQSSADVVGAPPHPQAEEGPSAPELCRKCHVLLLGLPAKLRCLGPSRARNGPVCAWV